MVSHSISHGLTSVTRWIFSSIKSQQALYQRKALLLDQVNCSIVLLDGGIKHCSKQCSPDKSFFPLWKEWHSVVKYNKYLTQLWKSQWNPLHSFFSCYDTAPVTHWAQWSRLGVQGELQTTRCGRRLEGTHSEETLIRGEEHPNFCSLRNKDPSQESSGLWTWAQVSDWLFRRGLWV